MPDLRFTPEEFERACSLLPEGTMWGDHLSVEIVLHIAQASRRAAIEEAARLVELNGYDGAAVDIRAIADGGAHG
jgi:hypothetical protein